MMNTSWEDEQRRTAGGIGGGWSAALTRFGIEIKVQSFSNYYDSPILKFRQIRLRTVNTKHSNEMKYVQKKITLFVYSKQTEMDVKSHVRYSKRLKITVYRHTIGLLTTQLLICHNFPCIHPSVFPSWLKFEYGAKTGLFWNKSLHRVFPTKMKHGFRRPRGPTSVMFFLL